VQAFEHWIFDPDADAPASNCIQRLAAYVRHPHERASGLIDLAPAKATNRSDGAAERIGERVKAICADALRGGVRPPIPNAEEAVMR
jgi:hypothetical protein